jgi:hypothetical protein
MTLTEQVKKVAEILKARFPNLTTNETIDLAFKIVGAINE